MEKNSLESKVAAFGTCTLEIHEGELPTDAQADERRARACEKCAPAAPPPVKAANAFNI